MIADNKSQTIGIAIFVHYSRNNHLQSPHKPLDLLIRISKFNRLLVLIEIKKFKYFTFFNTSNILFFRINYVHQPRER